MGVRSITLAPVSRTVVGALARDEGEPSEAPDLAPYLPPPPAPAAPETPPP
jgi:hypothetical protein